MGAYPWGPAQPLLEADVYLLAQFWDLLGHDSHGVWNGPAPETSLLPPCLSAFDPASTRPGVNEQECQVSWLN